MKILIIEPPAVSKFGNQRIFGGNGSNKSDFRKPPLDLMMVSGLLTKEGIENFFFDFNASKKSFADIRKLFKEISPDIVVFSTSTCTIYSDLNVAKIAKEVDESIITVALGTHVMALPKETFQESRYLDIIVYSGEWEYAVLNIVRNISNLEDAKGIYLRSRGERIVKTAAQPQIINLDSLGFPAHDKLQKELYNDPTAKRLPKTMVMGQKACINNCSFCCQPAFFGAPAVRRRSIPHFLDELIWVGKLGFKEVMFNDATLTSDISWAVSLMEGMIKKEIGLTWNCSTRADCVNPEIIKLMRRAGCHTIALGMESVDPTVLKNIRKNIDPGKIRQAVSLIRKAGLNTIIYCVVGFPGETKESIKKTISFLKKVETTFITLGIAVPAPGTDFYKYIEDKNYLITKDWSKYDPMQKPVFNYPELSADEIAYYSNYGIKQFYLRPSYIFSRLISIKNIPEALSYLNNFSGFFSRYILKKRPKKQRN